MEYHSSKKSPSYTYGKLISMILFKGGGRKAHKNYSKTTARGIVGHNGIYGDYCSCINPDNCEY